MSFNFGPPSPSGLIFETNESRDALIAGSTDVVRYAAHTGVPEEIDPRPWHKIENQSSMGSCAGHARSSVAEMCYRIKTGKVIQFSRMWCYLTGQNQDNIVGDSGSTISGQAKSAKQDGHCLEATFPYPNPVRYHRNIPRGAAEEASNFQIQSYTFLKSYDDVFNYLASGIGGVFIGISWCSTNGTKPVFESWTFNGGGHSTALLGYANKKDSRGRKYLWHANSWGERVADKGWSLVAPSVVDMWFRHRYTVIVGMSDMEAPEPRFPDVTKWEIV